MSDPVSQNHQILRALRKGKFLTPLEALKQFGCLRLAARINDLKGEGYSIQSTLETRRGKRYARYKMGKAA